MERMGNVWKGKYSKKLIYKKDSDNQVFVKYLVRLSLLNQSPQDRQYINLYRCRSTPFFVAFEQVLANRVKCWISSEFTGSKQISKFRS